MPAPAVKPDLSCPVPAAEVASYYTSEQSVLNTARKDKFIMVMDVPCGLRDQLRKQNCHRLDLDRLQLTVWGHVIPETSVPMIEKKFGGQTFTFSSNSRPVYPASTVNFTVDNKLDNYAILRKWLDLQNDAVTGISTTSDSYKVDLSILMLDEYEKPVVEFIYVGSHITSIGSVNVSTRDPAEMESTFTFNFSKFFMVPLPQP